MAKKRTSPNRNVQIADQIQRDLSELVRDVKDPRIGMVTMQSVELTPDYAHAKVYFTTLTGDPKETEAGLNHAAGHLHNLLFKRLHIHTVPTLHFHYDQTVVRAVEMSKLIDEVNSTRAKDDEEDKPRRRGQSRRREGCLTDERFYLPEDPASCAGWCVAARQAARTVE
ncbi:MAG: Ribosome-binding factor A [uncultured Caballeronia sp.]|nr:MAG: Ribosome-binding factor A [uncultured Caballeronia sp.]